MYHDFESHSISRRSFLKGAGAVGAASLLAACGGSSSSTAASASSASSGAAASGKGLSELFTYETSGREIESWNMLYSQQAIDFNVTTNIIDGLVSFDNYGKPVPALAKSWEHNEDSTVWTFHLRDDVDWVDMNGEVQDHLTSKDFLVGFEWVLNAKKNQAANTSMPSTTVVGAADYYDKTYAMDDAAAAALTYDDMLAAGVGIDAPDDYTVVYTCINPCPYFDTVASYVCCYPAPPALVEKLGVEGFRGVDYTQQWCCGPYLIGDGVGCRCSCAGGSTGGAGSSAAGRTTASGQDACSAHDAGSLEEAAAADGMRLKICVHCVFLPIILSCLGSMAQGTLPCRFPTPTRLSAPLYYQRIQKSAETDPSVCVCAPPVKSLTRHILYHRNKWLSMEWKSLFLPKESRTLHRDEINLLYCDEE